MASIRGDDAGVVTIIIIGGSEVVAIIFCSVIIEANIIIYD